jgi:predicted dehydrogenase
MRTGPDQNELATPLRFGLLGASPLAAHYIVGPAKQIPGVVVTAVAARKSVRAEAFAAELEIPVVCGSYDEVIASEDVDAVYVPLPASAHYEWCERALLNGKHVLCEKPLAMSAAEAERLVAIAGRCNRCLIEGFHYRHHPLISRALEVIGSGEIGVLEAVEAVVASSAKVSATLWEPALGGGAMRHNGCYAIHVLRALIGGEPSVLGAEATWRGGVDAAVAADLLFPGNVGGTVHASMIKAEGFEVSVTARGALGSLRIDNFFGVGPLYVQTAAGRRREDVEPEVPTSLYQLEAFVASAQRGAANVTSDGDIVANAFAIESILVAAGDGI